MGNPRPDRLCRKNKPNQNETMKLKLACADFTFPLLSHDRVLDLIAMLEFEGVDIGLFEGRSHLHPSKVFKSPAKSGAELGRKLAARRLKCADVFLQTDPSFVRYAANHPEAPRRRRARDWFLKTREYTAAAGAQHVTALPGVYFDEEKAAASWDRCCQELDWRVEQARAGGLVFGIEAHVGSIVPKPGEALRLVRAVPGLTLTLDYTHFTRAGLPDSAAEPLVAHASHFHARGARRGRLQTSLQQNTIDYKRVVRAMRRTGYHGYVGVEYVWIDWEHCNEVDNLSETIQMRDFLRAAL
jgi:sugar phosphate isomerase/epimerase